MVVGRTELMATMFGLLTFVLWVRCWRKAAFLCFFLALLSKEIAITIPLMIFIYEYLFGVRRKKTLYLPFAAVLALYVLIRCAVLSGFVSIHQTGLLGKQNLIQRVFTVIQGLGYYLKLLVLPYPLTPDYSDVPLPSTPFTSCVWGALVIVVLLYSAWILKVKGVKP